MSHALSAPEYIYQGVWVNWHKDRGAVLGSTLTVNPYFASLLSPAIAIFVSIAGSQLWRLFQFALHQTRATSRPRELLYHQQQVILRNTATDLNTIYRLIRTAIAWRHQKDAKVFRTSIPLLIWSILHFSLIVLAGLFSSWLLEAGNDVLSRSPFCGTFSSTYGQALDDATVNITHEGVQLLQEYTYYHNARYATVQQHVEICQNGQNDSDVCDMTLTQSLPWKSRTALAACPFDPDLCHQSIQGPLLVDTGYISSDHDFGFNAPKKDRIALRLVAQCSPLNDAKYSTDWQLTPATAEVPAREIAESHYGQSDAILSGNSTFTLTKSYMDCAQRTALQAYGFDSVFAAANLSSGTFMPIEGLQRVDADISLISLVSNSFYLDPVLDPWFSAQEAFVDPNTFCYGINRTVYTRQRPLTTMGCTQQWQVCNTDSPDGDFDEQCTVLMGLTQLREHIAGPNNDVNLTPRQVASANRILSSAVSSSFYYIVNALANSPGQLSKAARQMASNTGPAPPTNQWQIEIEGWMPLLLGILQQTILDFGTGQFVASTSYINTTQKVYDMSANDPDVAAAQWLCQNQIIHSRVYKNYNFFALVLLIVICTISIILGLSIEDVIGYARQRSLRHSGGSGKHGMWNTNSDLEMLKTIDEIRNQSTWGISRNGVWLGPPGYKISINNLKADDHEAEEGLGIVTRAVKRRRTEQDMVESSPCKRGFPRCQTCSSSDPSSTGSSPRKKNFTRSPTNPQKARLDFQNDYESDYKHEIPQIEITEVSSQGTINAIAADARLSTRHSQRSQRFPVSPQTISAVDFKPAGTQIADTSIIDQSGANSHKNDCFTSNTASIPNSLEVGAPMVSPLLEPTNVEHLVYLNGYTTDYQPAKPEHVYELSTDRVPPVSGKRSTAGSGSLPRRVASLWDLRSGRVSKDDRDLVR